MKLHILSDIHIEFAPFQIPKTDADVIILAGDIGVGLEGILWAKEQYIDKPILYVAGNHEYYQHDISLIDQLKSNSTDNLYIMDNEVCIIDDVRFLCATLWTDFALYGEGEKYFSIRHAKNNMSDFSLIKNGNRAFSPDDSIKLHDYSRDWLKHMLSEPFDGKTVVVTHHSPSPQSIAPRFQGDLLTPAFTTDLEHLMDGSRVALWVHGHTHDVYDYQVYGSRVVCNPRGYVPYEQSNGFDPEFVVEIG
jgi:predicted phosphodiesterase